MIQSLNRKIKKNIKRLSVFVIMGLIILTSTVSVAALSQKVYIKDGENISKFLAFIGANKSVLDFEETRVMKDMRNQVNRIVNCETYNLNKVVASSVKQIDDIKLIKKHNKFDTLTDKERELAKLRLDNPNATLKELGEMLEISKSGVGHRFEHIAQIAEELRNK